MDNRNRVSRGTPTGGEFAAQKRAEADGVTLTAETSPLDTAAVSAAGDLARSAVKTEIGTWQRRVERYNDPLPEMPEVLVDVQRRAKDFENLSRDDQAALMDKLKLNGAAHLLEPGQRFGNDRIAVAEGFESEPEDTAVVLMAQKAVTDAGLPGDITLNKVDNGRAEFSIDDRGISHRVTIAGGYYKFAAEVPGADYDSQDWMDRADIATFGPKVAEPGMAASLRSTFEQHRETAIMASAAGDSAFREHWDKFGELNRQERTAELVEDGKYYTLDLSSDEPVLKMDDNELHPSMARGFMGHMANETRQGNTDTFVRELREVFRDADRRSIR